VFIGVAATVIWLCLPVVLQFMDFDQRSEAAGVPVWIAHSLVPIGLAIMILATLVRIGERFGGAGGRR
jgi:TRAP-type C4-dicarboxylate transport system permease small subunit